MAEILRLTLAGYRTHSHLEVDLSAPVTVLTGPNQSGKSNVLRAARWLALNEDEPLERILAPGATEAVVRADLDTGGFVERVRSKRANLYRLQPHTGADVVELAKVGAGAIPEVTAILGLRPVDIGRGSVNVSFQGVDWRSPLDLAQADFAALLGAVSGAARVEAAVKEASSATIGLRSAVKEAEANVSTAQAAVDQLRVAEQIPEVLDRVRTLSQHGRGLRARLQGILGLRSSLLDLDASLGTAEAVGKAKVQLAVVQDLYAQRDGLWARLNRIQGLGREIQAADTHVDSLRAQQAQAREAFTAGLKAAGVCPLCGGQVTL